MQRRPDFQGIDVSLSQDLSEDEAKTVISSINQFCEQVLRYLSFIYLFIYLYEEQNNNQIKIIIKNNILYHYSYQ
jgi:hypothetical protein